MKVAGGILDVDGDGVVVLEVDTGVDAVFVSKELGLEGLVLGGRFVRVLGQPLVDVSFRGPDDGGVGVNVLLPAPLADGARCVWVHAR